MPGQAVCHATRIVIELGYRLPVLLGCVVWTGSNIISHDQRSGDTLLIKLKCCDLIYCRKLTTTTSTNPVGASTTAQESVSAWRSCQTSPNSTTPLIAPSSSNTCAIARQYDPGSLRDPFRSCHARGPLLLLMVQCALWLASMLVARLSAAIQQIQKQLQVGSTQCAVRRIQH
jgi:hypothetical protein